jgi:Immunity protein 50
MISCRQSNVSSPPSERLRVFPAILGADAVVAWFGQWPSFHDAEILSIHINRGGLSVIRIHTRNLSTTVDRPGHSVRAREAILAFEFAGIKTLRLHGEDADRQNVIQGLEIQRTDEGYRVQLLPCYGLAGEIVVEQIAVHVEPGR